MLVSEQPCPAGDDLKAPAIEPAQESGRKSVREMTAEDVQSVAGLFLDRFRDRPARRSAALEECLRAVLFRPEHASTVPPGLVAEARTGQLSGFVACAPQEMVWDGRRLQANGGGTLMVARRADPLTVTRLLRRWFALPHDLAYTDTASPMSAALLERFGARLVPSLSLDWLLVRSRAGLALRLGLDRARLRWLDRALGQTVATRSHPRPGRAARPVTFRSAEQEPDTLSASLVALGAAYPIRPDWAGQPAPLLFRLGELRLRRRHGSFKARVANGANGDPVALWLGHMAPGRVGQVTQALAHPDAASAMLDDIATQAGVVGCVAVRGRLQPDLLGPLARRRALFLPRLATLVQSPDADLLAACERGEAHLTGLAGETWSRLFDDVFD